MNILDKKNDDNYANILYWTFLWAVKPHPVLSFARGHEPTNHKSGSLWRRHGMLHGQQNFSSSEHTPSYWISAATIAVPCRRDTYIVYISKCQHIRISITLGFCSAYVTQWVLWFVQLVHPRYKQKRAWQSSLTGRYLRGPWGVRPRNLSTFHWTCWFRMVD